MADAVEAARQDVKEEAADKLVGADAHDLLAFGLGATIVLVAHRDAALVERDEMSGSISAMRGSRSSAARGTPSAMRANRSLEAGPRRRAVIIMRDRDAMKTISCAVVLCLPKLPLTLQSFCR